MIEPNRKRIVVSRYFAVSKVAEKGGGEMTKVVFN
jgi:hypothetical protein